MGAAWAIGVNEPRGSRIRHTGDTCRRCGGGGHSGARGPVGDDTEVLREFLLDFGDGAASIAREIATASAQTQAQDAGLLAHKLKSSARAVGALVLGDRCELIEQAGKAGDNRAVAELLADFDRELAAVQAYIDQNWDRKASN